MTGSALQIRVLGELEVGRVGQRLRLPPSKKTRALLAYLALTGRPHRRERLCELLWDVTDDPRAALRWSLSKLRELVDGDGVKRLRADREHVELDTTALFIDVREVRRLSGTRPEDATTEALEAARALFRGQLLEGLELDDFHAYQAFCAAERRELHELHKRILHSLFARLGTQPDHALPLARELVELDPLDELARGQLARLLEASGRRGEAEAAERARQRLIASAVPAVECSTHTRGSVGARTSRLSERVVGRKEELATLRASLADHRPRLRVVLLEGEAGIGKSHLLRSALETARADGACVAETTVQELVPGGPFAPWLELLRGGALTLDDDARALLERLDARDETRTAPPQDRVFQGVARVLADNAHERALVLAFDDAHWCDEASTALLQYVMHACRDVCLRIVLAARSGELADRPALQRLLREVRRRAQLDTLFVGPLADAETRELVLHAGTDSAERVALVCARSGGHPLFALELARAPGGDAREVPVSITQALRDRMAALSPDASELVRWAAILGTSFELPLLEAVWQGEASVSALEQLERHAFLRLDAEHAGQAAFVHDIVRHAVYDGLSPPRRRLMHQRVAALLDERHGAAGTRATELAHHAALAGDAALAAKACLHASRHYVRLFAEGGALTLARRGLAYAESLPEPARTCMSIDLAVAGVLACKPTQVGDLLARLALLCERALDFRELEHARRGFYARSFAMWERGQFGDAGRFMRESERISRLGDERARINGLCDAANCLVTIERDLPIAEAFVLEAEALATRAHVQPSPLMLPFARGTLDIYRGAYAEAAATLARARDLAREQGDRLYEFYALVRMFEGLWWHGEHQAALDLGDTMSQLARRLREGSDAPYAEGLHALARYKCGLPLALDALEGTLLALERADAQQRSAYLLAHAAEAAYAHGDAPRAERYARAGLAAAQVVARPSEQALCLSVLVQLAQARRAGDLSALSESLAHTLTGHVASYARTAAQRALGVAAQKSGGKHEARRGREGVR